MENTLLTKGIILQSGEVNKNKVNLVARAITQSFAEMVWLTTGGDMETVNRLTDVLVTMNTPTDRGKLFKIIKMLYGLMGLQFSEEPQELHLIVVWCMKSRLKSTCKRAVYTICPFFRVQ